MDFNNRMIRNKRSGDPGVRTARSRGFSLVELLGVMAVIAFMFVVAGVNIDAFVPKERLNTAVRTLTEQLRELRSGDRPQPAVLRRVRPR